MGAIHYRMILLYDSRQAAPIAKLFAAQIVSASWLAIVAGTCAGLVAGGDWSIMGCGVMGACGIPFAMIRSLDHRLGAKRQILWALPEFLNKLAILVNAGETIQQAVIHSAERMLAEEPSSERGKSGQPHPWLVQMQLLAYQLANRVPFPRAMENLNKRCAVQEVTLFTTTILLNHRRGGRICWLRCAASDEICGSGARRWFERWVRKLPPNWFFPWCSSFLWCWLSSPLRRY